MVTSAVEAPEKPWLRNPRWARRRLVDQGLRWPFLLLAYVVGAAILVAVLATVSEGSDGKLMGLLGLTLIVVVILALLTRIGLRRIRYGETICHLITLPGVPGGWFKADIVCSLPASASPVSVRLKNVHPSRYGEALYWSMEQACSLVAIPSERGVRSIAAVRLQVPRHPSQKFASSKMPFALGAPLEGPVWRLELEKKAKGVDFLAAFIVPIYDTRDAPPEEQRP
jgi:hypothetical protein